MREMYYKDGETLYKATTCTKCGCDRLSASRKSLSEVMKLVENNIAFIMPMDAIETDEGITYRCECRNKDTFMHVEKDIPVWINKEVYNLEHCRSCGNEEDLIIEHNIDSMLNQDQAEDFLLTCPKCESSMPLNKLKNGYEEDDEEEDWSYIEEEEAVPVITHEAEEKLPSEPILEHDEILTSDINDIEPETVSEDNDFVIDMDEDIILFEEDDNNPGSSESEQVISEDIEEIVEEENDETETETDEDDDLVIEI